MAEKPLSGLLSDTRTLNFRTNLDNDDDLKIEIVRQYLTATCPGSFSLLVRKTLAEELSRGEHFAKALIWMQGQIAEHDSWERQKINSRLGKFTTMNLPFEASANSVEGENSMKRSKPIQSDPKSQNYVPRSSAQTRLPEQQSLEQSYEDFDFLGVGEV